MFGNLGFTEILLIVIVALVIFGPQKLPELGRAAGKTIREFKKGARELMEDVRTQPEAQRADVTPQPAPTVAAAAAQEPTEVQPSTASVPAAAEEAVQAKARPAADPRRLPE